MNGREAEAAVKAIPYPHNATKDTRAQLKAEYNAAVDSVVAKFRASLAKDYAYNLPAAVQDRIWSKAWDDGHHAGYSEVEGHYEELSEFAEAVAAAVR